MFSRIMLLCAWFARPVMMNAAFSTFIIPCLGFLFIPFTTLMYVFLVQGVGIVPARGMDRHGEKAKVHGCAPGEG